jgi:hypothetical protein
MRGLVDKLCALGYKHTLTLEFRHRPATLDRHPDPGSRFPKFGEKGRVVILDVSWMGARELAVRSFSRPVCVRVADSSHSQRGDASIF